jgi:hypothetical protein
VWRARTPAPSGRPPERAMKEGEGAGAPVGGEGRPRGACVDRGEVRERRGDSLDEAGGKIGEDVA